jgi:hypothetical protein
MLKYTFIIYHSYHASITLHNQKGHYKTNLGLNILNPSNTDLKDLTQPLPDGNR